MRKTRWLAAFVLPLLLVSFLQSQSLADLAKKEKERRAALKGKPATVITTADLAKVKKRPAVESTGAEQTGEEAAAAAGAEGKDAVKPPVTTEGTEAAKPGGTVTVIPNPAAEAAPGEAGALTEKDFLAKQAELMKAVADKQDMVELLTLKLNALYQQFNNLDNMQSREFVQSQISQTYDKLIKAQTEANKAAKDLEDFTAKAKRENAQAIWIK
ncbi:MAG TPA: hypothetical protein VKT17_10055 [Acidobacteriota bacterium]|nr:hypothetical protein [Acidobacteriota bacterium]